MSQFSAPAGPGRPDRESIANEYRARRERDLARAGFEKKRAARVAWARLAVFVGGVWVAWQIWEKARLSPGWMALPIAIFVALMWRHAQIQDRKERAERGARFYEQGLSRLAGTWMGNGLTGDSYRDPKHPYASDLDLFGKGSLFELVATTPSPWGADRLASWLLSPADPGTILSRQEAIRELTLKLDLREALAVEAGGNTDPVDVDTLARWASEPPVLTARWARWLAMVLGVVTLGVTIAWLASWVPRAAAFAAMLVSGTFALAFRSGVVRVIQAVEKPAQDLGMLSALLARLEAEEFSSASLRKLQDSLKASGVEASEQIRRFRRIAEWLDARRNQLFLPVAALLLWGTQFAFILERFREQVGPEIPAWLDAVAEFDALMALANYAYEHPDDRYPEIADDDDESAFEAKGLGHPLIVSESLVRNDVSFGGELRLLVVSGSNMSGKSTLLRAVGVNVLLALAGAPVCASRLRLSRFRLAAAIRVQDSLQDGISFFYAEILRLRQVMDLASEKPTLLFLLDEILQGTNSHDRRIGADAVVRSLVERGAVGLITTHDLALAKLADSMGGSTRNIHFVDHIENGKILFDYRIHPGVVQKSNALELMRSVGLDV